MKEMTATEVARNFSAVLDAVRDGESVMITRGGEQIATIVPTPRANGAAVAEALRKWGEHNDLDDEWEAHMRDTVAWIRSVPADLDRDPWQE